jgi:WD40 repeat protein
MRIALLILTILACVVPLRAADVEQKVSYAQVQLVLAKHCLACHDSKQAEGKLVMESYELLMKGGEDGEAIVPGKADQSVLVRQIEHKQKPYMPPKKAKDHLSADEIQTIRAWINGGAPAPAPGEAAPLAAVSVPRIEPAAPPRKAVRAIVWSPQAKLAAIAIDGEIELLSVEERAVVRRLRAQKGNVNALAFSADGWTLAAGAGEPGVAGEIDLWNVHDGTLLKQLQGHKDAVYSVALSPDGKTLASGGYDSQIILWNLESGKPIRSLDGHNGAVLGLAFRPDGNVLASASADRTVKLWDPRAGTRLDTFAESLKELNSISFSPDGQRVAAGGADNRIRIWQVSAAAKAGANPLLVAQFGHEGAILRLAFSTDGKMLASAADDRTIKLWDPQPTSASGSPELRMLRVLPPQSDWPTALAFAQDDKVLLVGRLDGTVGFYDPATGAAIPAPKPVLAAVEPPGVQRGHTTTLDVQGTHLSNLTGAWFSNARIKAAVLPGSSSIEVICPPDVQDGPYEMKVMSEGGESDWVKVFVDGLPQVSEKEPNDSADTANLVSLPADVWGKFEHGGDADYIAFNGLAGQTVVFDLAAQRLGSKANALIELLDSSGRLLAASNGFDADPEPLLPYKLPADGRYLVRVTELEAAASKAHFYRLAIGSFACVTGCYPLAVAPNSQSSVQLLGLNLPQGGRADVKAGAAGEADVALDHDRYRWRRPLKVMIGMGPEPVEIEPNDTPEHATAMAVPGSINGRIDHPGDADLFRFDAKAGQKYVLETIAGRRGSPVDTKLEILHPDGSPVQRVQLRAVRDSAITFRGFGANAVGGRLLHWEEMDLNQYLYMSGEVVKLMLAPRGPDSEYGFYTIDGKRQCYFGTTATAHALDEKCYIVEPHKPGETFSPNGLPTFTINYVNDDDSDRKLGSDSRLIFTAPADGTYLARITDAQNAGGERYVYRLTVRPAAPDFSVSINLTNPAVPPGAGKNFAVDLDRVDGFDGPVRVDISGAPPGFLISTPLQVEPGHTVAQGTIYASPEASAPTSKDESATRVTATGLINGKEVMKQLNGFGKISLAPKPMLYVGLDAAGAPTTRSAALPSTPPEITVVPGRFTPARLWVQRHDFKGELTFEADNLPHGVIIADIGLSGVYLSDNQSGRQIFLHTAPWVADQDRLCYVRALQGGNPTSMPVLIHVRAPLSQARK